MIDLSAIVRLTDLINKSTQTTKSTHVVENQGDNVTMATPTTLNTVWYPDVRLEIQDVEFVFPVSPGHKVS